MTCKCVSQNLGSYLDGELTGREMQAMRTHLYECAACAEEAESYRSLKSALSNLPCCAPPDDLEERLLRSVRLESAPVVRRKRGLYWGSAVATAAAAGFLFTWFAGPRSSSEPASRNVASHANELPFEISRDQAYVNGSDSLSGSTMIMPASYGGSSNGP